MMKSMKSVRISAIVIAVVGYRDAHELPERGAGEFGPDLRGFRQLRAPHLHRVGARPGVVQPGHAADVRVQPRRGDPVIRAGSCGGPVQRHAVVGNRLLQRHQYQRRGDVRGTVTESRGRHPRKLWLESTQRLRSRRHWSTRWHNATPGRRPKTAESSIQSYADAMEAVYEEFPNDPDVAALFAEALMNLQPWDYWTDAGEPKGRTEEFVGIIERTLEIQPATPRCQPLLHPRHRGLIGSRSRRRGRRSLDRDRPGSGHLVHMPSHIYIRVGRYSDAAQSNIQPSRLIAPTSPRRPPRVCTRCTTATICTFSRMHR